jgi:ankyrin repeat protein
VTGGHLETSRILIEAGADVNAVNDQNVTPLLMSVVNGDSRMFR